MNKCVRPESEKDQKPVDVYTDEELMRLTEQLRKAYNPAERGGNRGSVHGEILLVILYEQLCLGEAQEIRVGDIDIKDRNIHITRQYDETMKQIKAPFCDAKRAVPIADEVRGIIEKRIRGKQKEDPLFTSGEVLNLETRAEDLHVRANNIRSCLYSAENLAGLDRHTINDLKNDGIAYAGRKEMNLGAM